MEGGGGKEVFVTIRFCMLCMRAIRDESKDSETHRETLREREKKFRNYTVIVGVGSGLDITASERKVVSASEREIER